MGWMRRRKPRASDEALEALEASEVRLEQAKEVRRQVTEVSSSLRRGREVNHYADGIRQAFGGSPA